MQKRGFRSFALVPILSPVFRPQGSTRHKAISTSPWKGAWISGWSASASPLVCVRMGPTFSAANCRNTFCGSERVGSRKALSSAGKCLRSKISSNPLHSAWINTATRSGTKPAMRSDAPDAVALVEAHPGFLKIVVEFDRALLPVAGLGRDGLGIAARFANRGSQIDSGPS